MTVASLGIAVNSNADKASIDLDKLTASAGKADAAAKSLTNSAIAAAKAELETARAATASLRASETATKAEVAAALAKQRVAAAALAAAKSEAAQEAASRAAARAAAASATEMERLAVSSAKASTATSQMSLNSANIAAQLQDVAVSAQMGMNGIQVGLQQGTQLAAVLNQVRANGQGVGQALATSFMSIVNPISLVTIGLIGITTYGIQAFSSIFKETEDANDALEDHAKWLDRILYGYDNAARAATAAMDRASMLPQGVALSDLGASLAEQEQKAGAAATEIRRLREEYQQLQDIAARVAEQMDGFPDDPLGGTPEQREEAARYVALLDQMAISASSSKEELLKAEVAARELYNTAKDQALREAANQAYELARALRVAQDQAYATEVAISMLNNGAALDAAIESSERYAEAIGKIVRLRPELRSAREQATDALNEALGNKNIGGLERLNAIKEYEKTIAAIEEQERRREAARGSKSATKDFEAFGNSLRTAQERLATQQMEIEMFGQSTAALETMRVSQELTNQAKQNGIDLNSVLAGSEITVAEAIAQTAEKSGAVAQEMERLQYQQSQIDALNNTLAAGFANLFIGIADGSKSAQESIGDLLSSLGRLLINQAFQSLFQPTSLGGGGFNPFGFLMGPGRASGGPVTPGRIYPVNENTPNTEYFAPAVSGTILTAQQVAGAAMGAMGGRQGVDVRVSVDRNGNLVAIARQVAADEVDKYDRFKVPYRVHSLKNNAVPVVG